MDVPKIEVQKVVPCGRENAMQLCKYRCRRDNQVVQGGDEVPQAKKACCSAVSIHTGTVRMRMGRYGGDRGPPWASPQRLPRDVWSCGADEARAHANADSPISNVMVLTSRKDCMLYEGSLYPAVMVWRKSSVRLTGGSV